MVAKLTACALVITLGALLGYGAPRIPSAMPTIASPLWHVAGEGWGTPAADAATAYFLAKAHEVVALDAATGAERWRARTGETGPTTAGSLLLLAGDVVVAGDYNVMAFDRRDGALRWRFTPADGYGPGIYLGATMGELVFTGSPSGRIYAIDHRSGTARWSALVADDDKTTVYPPVSDGEIVVAAYTTFDAPMTGGVIAVDVGTGRERWRAAFPRPADGLLDSAWGGGPLLLDTAVAAVSTDGTVFAFDRTTGAVQWTLPRWSGARGPGAGAGNPAAPRDRDFRPLARSATRVFVGSLSGEVIAYDLGDRSERWRYASALNGSVAFRLGSDERSVYVPYVDGRLIALDAGDGRERWRTSDRFNGFSWPPAIDGERVYGTDAAAGFFAFGQ